MMVKVIRTTDRQACHCLCRSRIIGIGHGDRVIVTLGMP
jgi:hypothetical protein